MHVEISLMSVKEGHIWLLMGDNIRVLARLQELHMAVYFLIRIVLDAQLSQFLSVSYLGFLIAKHPEDSCLPELIVVLFLGL